jgi:hypothetical protein
MSLVYRLSVEGTPGYVKLIIVGGTCELAGARYVHLTPL